MPQWIDMRQHIKGLTRGDSRTIAQGKWIVLRVFRRGQYSQYWNEARKEAIGGPKWRYDDLLVRAIAKPGTIVSKSGSASSTPPVVGVAPLLNEIGLDDPNTWVFAIEVLKEELPREPLIGDRVYDIQEYGQKDKPIAPVHATAMYDVLAVVREHGDYGRAEVFYLFAQKQTGVS